MPVKGAGSLLGRCVLVTAGALVACALLWPAGAAAESFTVNTTADATDAVVGNEFCETASGLCTLRAAIEESNAAENEDVIGFVPELFKGDADSVIELGAPLPIIVHPIGITTDRCDTEAGVRGPCVQIDGLAGAPALAVEGAAGVDIQGLALTNSEAGVAAMAAPRLKIHGNWVGFGLDGAAAGNAVGIELGPGSDESQIGREDPEQHNLIANSAGTGLAILGSSEVRVLGNELGIDPNADQAAPNGADIIVESSAGEADAVGNVIGTRGDAASSACELGCNLVSGSESNGIDLSGAGPGDPPIATTIVGNHIGLDRTGAASLPNTGVGILVGTAADTVIGGPRGGDANRIVGGTAAVVSGPGAPHLVVQRNLIGTHAGATGPFVPPDQGIVVDSQGFSFASEEALILENEVGLAGGTGISQQGPGATIARNEVSGAGIGIRVHGEGSENLIERNTILESGEAGILVENSFNDIVGNQILGADGAGIRIQEAPPEAPRGNVVGGDTEATENEISGSDTAIAIADADESLNEVARNRGSGNAGRFIDLIATESGGVGPNHGIDPPAIVAISESGVAGFAEPGARVRLFRKATPASGEIASFFGDTTADIDGKWTFTFPAALPVGAAIAATQTKEEGTSELEIATVPPTADAGQQTPAAATPVDRKPPRTRMLRQPRRVAKGALARFVFTSNEAGSSFQCSLDHAPFRPCRSPKKYRLSKLGKHLFRVRAVDGAGNVDKTPLRRRFEVVG